MTRKPDYSMRKVLAAADGSFWWLDYNPPGEAARLVVKHRDIQSALTVMAKHWASEGRRGIPSLEIVGR